MYPLVEEYLSSGLSQQQFCQAKSIACSTFHYWIRKYKTENTQGNGFLDVDTRPAVPVPACLELTYPNGVRLSISGADLVLISELIRLC